MVKAPAKQPAFPLMVGDILKDPRLSQASLFSRGVWTILLLYMWEWDQRGEIETTIYGLNRLLKPDSIEEILFFLNELADLEFGSIFTTDKNKKLTFPLTLENCNMKVTIRNRKMYSEYKDRQNTRLRVQKHREKKAVTQKKQKCNTDVTPSLSVSTSITTSNTKKYKKDFLQFYEKYPLKKNKEKALKTWEKHKPDLNTILKALELQILEKEALVKDGLFCPEWPYPSVWINNKRWEDEPYIPKKHISESPKEKSPDWVKNLPSDQKKELNELIGGIGG